MKGWSEAYSSQAEIWQYMKSVCSRYDVTKHLRANSQVLSTEWMENKKKWKLTYKNTKSKSSSETTTLYFDMM
jgi:cation diffusion facilitator CzcD-associated flavoprotein CzcO